MLLVPQSPGVSAQNRAKETRLAGHERALGPWLPAPWGLFASDPSQEARPSGTDTLRFLTAVVSQHV